MGLWGPYTHIWIAHLLRYLYFKMCCLCEVGGIYTVMLRLLFILPSDEMLLNMQAKSLGKLWSCACISLLPSTHRLQILIIDIECYLELLRVPMKLYQRRHYPLSSTLTIWMEARNYLCINVCVCVVCLMIVLIECFEFVSVLCSELF